MSGQEAKKQITAALETSGPHSGLERGPFLTAQEKRTLALQPHRKRLCLTDLGSAFLLVREEYGTMEIVQSIEALATRSVDIPESLMEEAQNCSYKLSSDLHMYILIHTAAYMSAHMHI